MAMSGASNYLRLSRLPTPVAPQARQTEVTMVYLDDDAEICGNTQNLKLQMTYQHCRVEFCFKREKMHQIAIS